ncbi:MAG: glycoside hydrolase family 127 protein, partial [Ruminiclostridium sp.]|nr:glycoside hydrolase family 127 protein [Ruminiclostridium sp.]
SNSDFARSVWFGTACCPPNLLRTVASIGGYIYTQDGEGNITVNQYIGNTAEMNVGGESVNVTMEGSFPWDGNATLTVNKTAKAAFAIRFRIPEWAKGENVITLNGEEEEPTPDTPAEEEGFDQTKADVEAAAESGDILMQTATFGDVEAVRYTKVVSSKEIENAKSVTFTFESKDANGNVIGTGTYTSNKYYTSLMASGAKVDAPENYVFLSLTVKDIPDGVTLKCTGITLS